MNHQLLQGEARTVDATTREGFLEIAEAFGRQRAHEARIAKLRARAELVAGFRWHANQWHVRLGAAIFERDYELANPVAAAMLRENGVGY